MQHKQCSKCLTVKPTSEFHKQKAGRFGVESRCKVCKKIADQQLKATPEYKAAHAARMRKWREENPEEYRAYIEANRDKIRETSKNSGRRWRKREPNRHIFYKAKYRARDKGIPFDIELTDVNIPEYCPVLGIKLEAGAAAGSPQLPSIDRIIPSKGYVKGNIQVISHRANRIKTDASLEELRKVVAYAEKATQSSSI